MLGKMWRDTRESFEQLADCPRELWLVYVLEILEGFSYFSLAYSLVLYLSEEFGYNDVQAGWVYGVYGMLISVFGLSLGFVIDVVGVRNALIFSNVTLLFGRLWLAFSTSESGMLVMLYVAIPVGQAMLQPAMSTGIRRYTQSHNRSMGFSLFYVALNLGALLAAPAVDLTRTAVGEGVSIGGVHMTGYRMIIAVGAVATAVATALTCAMRDVDVAKDEKETVAPVNKKPHEILKEVLGTVRFWKFMLLIVLLVGVGMIFRHMHATFPKYMIRTHGEDVAYGTILSVNPLLIIFIVPALTPIVKHHSQYNVILVGSSITAVSVLWMLAADHVWGAVLFVITLSFGEALWSPRVFEYTSMIAPKGREGTYMALSSAPGFVAKVLVGGMSGWLLERYCPSRDQCDGTPLWLIVFAVTASSPVLMFVLKPLIADEDVNSDNVSREHAPDPYDTDAEAETAKLLANNPNRPTTVD